MREFGVRDDILVKAPDALGRPGRQGCHDGRVTETTNVPSQRRLTLSSVLPVWVLAVVGVVLVLTLAAQDAFAWLLLVFVLTVLVSFALQLATQTKDGLVERISVASTGSFVVVLVGTVVLLLR
jgi:hypothetical protein